MLNERDLKLKSAQYRKALLRLIKACGAGHTGGDLSCLDIQKQCNHPFNHEIPLPSFSSARSSLCKYGRCGFHRQRPGFGKASGLFDKMVSQPQQPSTSWNKCSKLKEWVSKGYFNDGFISLDPNQAALLFASFITTPEVAKRHIAQFGSPSAVVGVLPPADARSNDTLTGLTLLYIGFGVPFGVLVMRGFFRTVPTAIIEAARIDGASYLRIFFCIAPLAACQPTNS